MYVYLLQVKHQVDFPEEIMYILIFLKVKLSDPPMHLVWEVYQNACYATVEKWI